MQTARELKRTIEKGDLDSIFQTLYGDHVPAQKKRYLDAIDAYQREFGENDPVSLFSSPGRTEIGGNHTDHNRGKVLAGSVDLDIIAVASPLPELLADVRSAAFSSDRIDLSQLEPQSKEKNRSAALIRGVAKGLSQRGYAYGGFRAYTDSRVPKGSGVSSSAAFEVLLATVQNTFYNQGKVSPVEIAQISQFAEREYFGKPCGLMDQAACALGGICMIDFADEKNPVITPIPFRFAESGYKVCLVAVGGDHADLTDLYAAIPEKMHRVAAFFGEETLSRISFEQLLSRITLLRKHLPDDAILAAMHFLRETERVPRQAEALRKGDFPRFLSLITASGHSSYEYLQNVWIPMEGANQGAAIALNLASDLLAEDGAWRIHGGGFGGTTQNFVPDEKVPVFRKTVESVFGEGACHVLSIRPVGPICLI